jgi:hypothetical protein
VGYGGKRGGGLRRDRARGGTGGQQPPHHSVKQLLRPSWHGYYSDRAFMNPYYVRFKAPRSQPLRSLLSAAISATKKGPTPNADLHLIKTTDF